MKRGRFWKESHAGELWKMIGGGRIVQIVGLEDQWSRTKQKNSCNDWSAQKAREGQSDDQ